ncbi:MAG TPA: glycosyltransferase [archaeon]|nr:glycosyltransferase [archaeon]
MKIAIFHDYIENPGGAEKLILSIARKLDATVITTNLNQDAVNEIGFNDVKIINLGFSPKGFFSKHIGVASKFFFSDFSKDFDFFIFSGNKSIFASLKHKPNLWYCHSPERAVFDLYDFYMGKMSLRKKIVFIPGAFFLRLFIIFFSTGIKTIACNSENVRGRIKNFLGRDSVVITPFIDSSNFYSNPSKEYWLSVNRLYPAKRIELQLEAFNLLPKEKLVIVGGFVKGDVSEEYFAFLSSKSGQNIEFRGTVNEKELRELYANCKGLIATALDEDFGMTVLEALASGKPVVAVNEGGFREILVHGKTGFLVNATSKELRDAVQSISGNTKTFSEACLKRSNDFSETVFVKKLSQQMRGALE